jgi:hypothetical protein
MGGSMSVARNSKARGQRKSLFLASTPAVTEASRRAPHLASQFSDGADDEFVIAVLARSRLDFAVYSVDPVTRAVALAALAFRDLRGRPQ